MPREHIICHYISYKVILKHSWTSYVPRKPVLYLFRTTDKLIYSFHRIKSYHSILCSWIYTSLWSASSVIGTSLNQCEDKCE
ncbi:hypothetical protein ACOME3_002520 [Neoechinorhynchus agilis]